MRNPFKKKIEEETISFSVQNEDWFGELMDSNEHTPDYHHLLKKQAHLLFVYDEMKKKHPKHDMVEKNTFPTDKPLPTAFSVGKFSLWKRQLGLDTEAVAMESEYIKPQLVGKVKEETEGFKRTVFRIHDDLVPKTIIKGELHAITPQGFKELDSYKENRVKSLRKRVKILVPHIFPNWVKDRDKQAKLFHLHEFHHVARVTVVRAWMYIGLPDYYDDLVDKGMYALTSRYRHNGGKGLGITDYYCFTGLDYAIGAAEKEQMISVAREKRKKEGFQLEWSTSVSEQQVSKPGTMSRMLEAGKRLIKR